jgi:hypothetical protein
VIAAHGQEQAAVDGVPELEPRATAPQREQ